jgi:carbon-monoxide dehydrogenase small subunit
MSKTPLHFTLNGRAFDLEVEPRRTLIDVIRDDCGFTGTHAGCEHGVCGACTIIVNGETVRSCLMFGFQAEGATIRTVESLSQGGPLHPLQEAFVEHHALQCGYCTPGFLMLAVGLLEENPDMDEAAMRDALSSNLCRCTGYENILKAVKDGAQRMKASHD